MAAEQRRWGATWTYYWSKGPHEDITVQVSMEEEVVIAINGPDIVNSEAVVKESVRVLTKTDNIHFVRSSSSVKPWVVSKSVDNLRKTVPRNNIMTYE
jgi:hypothetical protein